MEFPILVGSVSLAMLIPSFVLAIRKGIAKIRS
jgi:hypothetical protein